MSHGLTTLVAENDLETRSYLEMTLKCLGYGVELAQDGDEALECLHAKSSEIAAVLLDFRMPGRDGIETLREIRQFYPDLPVIMISEAPSPLQIVTVMKIGATDVLSKPATREDLRTAILRALDVKTVECLRPAKSAVSPRRAFLGTSPRMEAIHAMLGQIAWSEAPVLIQGETGSGKEMIARELHAQSPRAKKAFFKLNCAALPSELVESELFGYERGAFTGAFQRKPGIFETADGGTILLDEIGDMDVRLQAKLLQVLQDQEFQRIGGKDTIKVDVRVIAATHRALEEAIVEGRFREDLYYRLNVVTLEVPPLRERKGDIAGLAGFLLRKHVKPGVPVPAITQELQAAMLAWDWPGNVRELENFMRSLLIFQDPSAAAGELLARRMRKAPGAGPVVAQCTPAREDGDSKGGVPVMEQVARAQREAEAEAILSALTATRWNRKQAAALLQVDYKALLYKMKKLGIDDSPAGTSEHAAAMIAGSN
jgi:two-component system, NtrC family, response regulator AtoC